MSAASEKNPTVKWVLPRLFQPDTTSLEFWSLHNPKSLAVWEGLSKGLCEKGKEEEEETVVINEYRSSMEEILHY